MGDGDWDFIIGSFAYVFEARALSCAQGGPGSGYSGQEFRMMRISTVWSVAL